MRIIKIAAISAGAVILILISFYIALSARINNYVHEEEQVRSEITRLVRRYAIDEWLRSWSYLDSRAGSIKAVVEDRVKYAPRMALIENLLPEGMHLRSLVLDYGAERMSADLLALPGSEVSEKVELYVKELVEGGVLPSHSVTDIRRTGMTRVEEENLLVFTISADFKQSDGFLDYEDTDGLYVEDDWDE